MPLTKLKLTTCLSLLLLTSPTYSQSTFKLHSRAERKLDNGEYKEAVKLYKEILGIDRANYAANSQTALLYLYEFEVYDSARVYLDRTIKSSDKDTNVFDLYHLAHCLRMQEKPNEAIKVLDLMNQEFSKEISDQDEEFITELRGERELSRKALDLIRASDIQVKVENLGYTVNSMDSEYTTVYLEGDSTIVYNARYKDSEGEEVFEDNLYMENMYFYDFEESVSSVYDQSLDQEFHFAVVGKSFYENTFLICHKNKLWHAVIENEKIKELKAFPENLTDFYHQPHGIFSITGDTLIFSAKKTEEDNLDIYFTSRTGEDTWTNPTKISSRINTSFDEDSPFLSNDGKTLYFSSKGHHSIGGYDIFKSVFEDGKWSEPIQMDYPINSAGDDIYFVLNENGYEGYLSSNRNTGFGRMDLYGVSFPAPEIKRPCFDFKDNEVFASFEGFGKESELYADKKITFDTSPLKSDNQNILDYSWEINDRIVGNGAMLEYEFDQPGTYNLNLKLLIEAERQDSFCFNQILIIEEPELIADNNDTGDGFLNENDVKDITENNSGSTIELGPIYFDFDRYGLKSASVETLNKLVDQLNQSPNSKIIISGHTDSKGSDNYNITLSKKRANAAVDYLKKKGITEGRIIKVVSYGETKPAVPNTRADGSDDKNARKLNRRVEFTLINSEN